MTDPQAPTSAPEQSSLWTTPASPADTLPLEQAKVDKNVSAEQIRAAVASAKERAAVFAGRVSDEILRASVQ
jgi:hypothetical protein